MARGLLIDSAVHRVTMVEFSELADIARLLGDPAIVVGSDRPWITEETGDIVLVDTHCLSKHYEHGFAFDGCKVIPGNGLIVAASIRPEDGAIVLHQPFPNIAGWYVQAAIEFVVRNDFGRAPRTPDPEELGKRIGNLIAAKLNAKN